MAENKKNTETVDEYILRFDPETREKLQAVRSIVRDCAPDAEERMSWQMPSYFLCGILVQFAAHKNHIGFYPGPEGIAGFSDQFGEYGFSKGAVRFPFDKPLPSDLIRQIMKFKMALNTGDEEKRRPKS